MQEAPVEARRFRGDCHRPFTVDVFVSEPFDFDVEYEAAMRGEVAPGLTVRFVSIPALIAMKRLAKRPRDLDDIEHLQLIIEEKRRNEPRS